jgi:hypothetical protein
MGQAATPSAGLAFQLGSNVLAGFSVNGMIVSATGTATRR